MDANSKAVIVTKRRGPYRHHEPAVKRSIVEETLQPGASVARIARKHGINANQVFLWRKAYREGLLPENRRQRCCRSPSRHRRRQIDYLSQYRAVLPLGT